MVQDLTLILSDDTGGLSDRVNASIAAKIATLGSLNADVPTTSAQAQTFINALFACENSELTPSGRRIMTIVSTEDLEKKF